jgi:copper chaperone
MISYRVENMTCGHCVSTITAALNRVDAQARVHVDLETRRVDIDSARSSTSQFADAIRVAGYSPQAITNPTAVEPTAAKQRSSCCCA